ncbi:MAG: DUF4111 domain-containing protein [Oscillospiraceae bacterium]|nr:DUF4111 domain-containing protein [Oscillospiraceae bacterium]
MTFKNHLTASSEVKAQISQVADIWKEHLRKDLTGVYLHGSLALDAFVEGSSDIDILIVCDRRIPREERLLIAQRIIDVDRTPSPLEMSAVFINDLDPWRHPTPCQFHYSDLFTESYKQMLSGGVKDDFLIEADFTDPDIACHVRLTKQYGVCICGEPIAEVFPDVPETDFWDAISYDLDESDIMTLGRVLSYKREKRILSKHESALWMKNFLIGEIRREG